jgi:MFS transporter, SP family, general alpha glucoside:H+ symporter
MAVGSPLHADPISPTETTRPLTSHHDNDVKSTSGTAEAERDMTFRHALTLYPKAIGWSVYFSLGVIMLAFDPQLLGNLYATPAFQRDFGYEYEGSVRLLIRRVPSPTFK